MLIRWWQWCDGRTRCEMLTTLMWLLWLLLLLLLLLLLQSLL